MFTFQREVVLYLKTKDGRVCGAECTPFVLPKRWTYETLLSCVQDYVRRATANPEAKVDKMYYKKSKGKAVVNLNDDGDISSLLNEYPLTYKSGEKRSETVMYLAVDLHRGKYVL